tara:strand:- start:708 stop:1013 length:306 start_codon:yes stop_codon:yes gene_type:complete
MKKMNASTTVELAAYRWEIASRALLAIVGGYAISALYAASFSLVFPSYKVQAVLGATMFSFTVYCVVVIWAFSARSLARAWLVAGMMAVLPAIHMLLAWSA